MISKNQNIISFRKCLKNSKIAGIIGPLTLQNYFEIKDMPCIFVDGGTKYRPRRKAKNFLFYLSVGDHDSFKSKKRLDILVSRQKNFSDLEFALKIANVNNSSLFLDGFFDFKGPEARPDHLFANTGACFEWVKKNQGYVFLNSKCFILPVGKHHLELHGNFSLISLECGSLKLTGNCDFQLKTKTKITPMSAKTISNRGFGNIELNSNIPILVINF